MKNSTLTTNLVIGTCREGYSIDQIPHTMTVEEMIDLLEDYDPETKIYLSFDNGYTYGGIDECEIMEVQSGKEDEEFDDEEDED